MTLIMSVGSDSINSGFSGYWPWQNQIPPLFRACSDVKTQFSILTRFPFMSFLFYHYKGNFSRIPFLDPPFFHRTRTSLTTAKKRSRIIAFLSETGFYGM